MRKEHAVVDIRLSAKTYYDFVCTCKIEPGNPTEEQLDALAEAFYEEIDGGLYGADDNSWERVAAEASIDAYPQSQPKYRATLVTGEWQIEEIE